MINDSLECTEFHIACYCGKQDIVGDMLSDNDVVFKEKDKVLLCIDFNHTNNLMASITV
jgi:hypothetical protein